MPADGYCALYCAIRSVVLANTLAALFSAALALSVALGRLPLAALIFYIAISLFTYVLYYLDKSAARRGRWRIQERTLHLCALLGGWPGALLARQHLRHKTRKQPFRCIFWVTVLANLGLLIWLHTAEGTALLHRLPI